MSEAAISDRSYELFEPGDLRRLEELARKALNDLFSRRDYSHVFADQLKAICLAQGAALHFLDGKNGVKDFDVWCFFPFIEERKYPARTILHADFGASKYGRHPEDFNYLGRRVEIIGRTILFSKSSVEDSICAWLKSGRASAKALSKKAVIGIWPESIFGVAIWSTTGERT